MVRIHMDPRNVVTVPAFNDRHRMKVELVREQFLRFVTPFRNVEPEKSVGALPQGGQLPQVALVHVFRIDPAQLHGQSPFHICRPIPLTTRERCTTICSISSAWFLTLEPGGTTRHRWWCRPLSRPLMVDESPRWLDRGNTAVRG